MPRSILRLALVLTISIASSPAVPAPPTHYRMEFLPVNPGCQAVSQIHGLDDQGRTLGVMTCDGFTTQRAVLWENKSFTELGTFGGPNSLPYGLSSRGEVVGYAETSEVYQDNEHAWRPFLWTEGSLHDLGTLGGPFGAAASLNSEGTIVGICQPAEEDPRLHRVPTRACLWSGLEIRDLGDLGGPEAYAYDINNHGWVVGSSTTAEPLGTYFKERAFLYDGNRMRDLGTLGGPASAATSLNERGDVVGWSLTGELGAHSYPITHAFRWRSDVLYDLPSLGGGFSMAYDVNNQGLIVGLSYRVVSDAFMQARAVLWDGSSIVDLNSLLVDSDGWVLEQATAIDNRGRILANAYREGQSRIVLLIPISAE